MALLEIFKDRIRHLGTVFKWKDQLTKEAVWRWEMENQVTVQDNDLLL